MTKLEIALSYLNKGISVIPLYSPEMLKEKPPKSFREELQREIEKNEQSSNPLTKNEIIRKVLTNRCKTPCISGWKDFQHRLPTKEEVTNWFTMNPTANIAIITGAVSNLVVFDLDSEDAVQYAGDMGGFPDTVKAKTGRGHHIYMRHPGFDVGNQVRRALKIDIRGDGGYVAAPPSLHGSGRQYEWEEGHSIFDLAPAECTPWIIDYLKNVSTAEAPPGKEKSLAKEFENTITLNDGIIKAAQEAKPQEMRDEYLDLLQNGCAEGSRNQSATKVIGHLLKIGMKEEEVWTMVQLWNKEKVKPSLDLAELKKTFDSVNALEKKNQAVSTTTPKLSIESFLDNQTGIVSDYQQNYVRVPFANSNLSTLENAMNGGFAGGRFYIFGGIPSAGKTVLLNNIADNICLNNYPVLFFSYDDGKAELRYRTFSRFSGNSIEDFNMKRLPDIGTVCQIPTIRQIRALKYVVQQSIPVEKWTDLIDQIKKKHGKAPVIIVDYLRKLRTEKSTGDERLRVDDLLSKLTDIAKIHNTPVIAISELARDSYKSGQRLSMASFKESGTIEYEASWLGILGAVEEKNGEFEIKEDWDSIIEHDGNVDLIIFKAKRGTGATGKVPLKVDRKFMTVKDRLPEIASAQTTKNPVKTKF